MSADYIRAVPTIELTDDELAARGSTDDTQQLPDRQQITVCAPER
jgi:hypothetical protein